MVGKSEVRIRIIAHIVMILLSIFAVLPFVLLISASLTEEKAALNYSAWMHMSILCVSVI